MIGLVRWGGCGGEGWMTITGGERQRESGGSGAYLCADIQVAFISTFNIDKSRKREETMERRGKGRGVKLGLRPFRACNNSSSYGDGYSHCPLHTSTYRTN